MVGYSPDGDTMRFKALDESNWGKLSGPPISLNGARHASLRFEGIDALETHFNEWHQPLEYARAARDFLLAECGITNVVWNASQRLVVTAKEGTKGYVLTRAVEKNRRAVAFVFAGTAPEADGASIMLKAPRLRRSLNYKLLKAGLVYPTYYEGLFHDLRNALTTAAQSARKAKAGLWVRDATQKGFRVQGVSSITDEHVILPKLFRRMVDYLQGGGPITGFKEHLAANPDPLLILSSGHFTHLDTIVQVNGKRVKMTQPPENLVFNPMVSA